MPKKHEVIETEVHPHLQKLIESGIPVSQAHFHAAVNNADETPENYFNDKSDNRSRRAAMLWTPHGLICSQVDTKGEMKHFIVPPATVKFAKFK
jgi:hypothetical protein